MVVPQLDVYGYHGDFDLEWGASLPFPSLELVEGMLRQLDSNLYAGVSLQLHPREENEPAGTGLFVSGGPTGYFMQCQVEERPMLYYVHPGAPTSREKKCLISRDQQMWVEAFLIFSDFEIVLTAARHFYETAEPAPQLHWRSRPFDHKSVFAHG